MEQFDKKKRLNTPTHTYIHRSRRYW